MPVDPIDTEITRQIAEDMISAGAKYTTWIMHPKAAEQIAGFCGATLDELVSLGYFQVHEADA